jgi:hypothetical protein
MYITPEGGVALPQPFATFSAPSIATNNIRINNQNLNQLYQSKTDMATYITSGSLTNYVNTNSNQTIGGDKTFSNSVLVKSGRGSIKIYPQVGSGPACISHL